MLSLLLIIPATKTSAHQRLCFQELVWEADSVAMTTSVKRHVVSSETMIDYVRDETSVWS